MTSPELSVRRFRWWVALTLLAVAAGAWAVLVWQRNMGSQGAMAGMDAMSESSGADLIMGMGMPLFMGMWVLMMIAMMFPTAAPMVLTFGQISASRQRAGNPYVPTWFFVASYLAVWAAFGVAAFFVAVGVANLADRSMFFIDNAARIGGAMLLLAGLYQLSPLKTACLAKCRTPLSFVLTSWKDGHWGAFRMGVKHGTYCLGCCWPLFVILFPIGIMNVAAMGVVTLLIFTEKSLPGGLWAGRAVGVGLAAWGLAIILAPGLLITTV